MKFSKKHINIILALLILTAWFYLFRKTLLWMFDAYIIYENTFGPAVLIGIIAMLIIKSKQAEKQATNFINIEIKSLPFIVSLISVPAYLLSEYYIGLNILSSIIFGIGTYGLLGLFLTTKTWKQGLIPAILIIQTLPFGTNLDTYLGFPLRMFTTDIVTNILSGTGIENLQTETIIIIENRAANIDLSCSGMKGLWSGTLFFLFAVWIEKRKIDFYTIILFLTLITLLAGFNIARITALVLIDTVYNLPELAQMIHLPTGIIGFVLSLLIIWLLLRYKNQPIPKSKKEIQTNIKTENLTFLQNKTIPFLFLLSVIISANFLHFEKESLKVIRTTQIINFPKSFKTQELRLSKDEQKLLISDKNDSAKKIKFKNDKISGSVLISTTSNWRGHHKPELCFETEGFETDISETLQIADNFYIKKLKFKNKKQIACYWFQSENKTSSDYSARVWDAIIGRHTEWTIISVLFEEDYQKDLISDFLILLKRNINETENIHK